MNDSRRTDSHNNSHTQTARMSSKSKTQTTITSLDSSFAVESISSGESSAEYDTFESDRPTEEEDALSATSSGDGNNSIDIKVLNYKPADLSPDGHLFHMDIISSHLSDLSVQPHRRLLKPKHRQNISFSRDRVREIERHNQILLQRIMSKGPTLKTMPKMVDTVCSPTTGNSRITSAALNRKKVQRQIEVDNQILRKKLEKIERSKKCAW